MDKRNSSVPRKSMSIKIISMGNTEVGKSCIIKRFCEKRFISKYLTTIGIDYGVTRFALEDKVVRVNIFDMAGHPLFYEVRNEFYGDTQGALLVFDVGNRDSFEALDYWMREMSNEIGDGEEAGNIVICVCGNKVDCRQRAVDEVEGRLWAESNSFHYFETSAFTGQEIGHVFKTLVQGVVAMVENGGKRIPFTTQLGYTREQVEVIHRLKNCRSDHERLGVSADASKEDVNKAYRRLAVLLHPDKSVAPGSEEAFKVLVSTRTALLKRSS